MKIWLFSALFLCLVGLTAQNPPAAGEPAAAVQEVKTVSSVTEPEKAEVPSVKKTGPELTLRLNLAASGPGLFGCVYVYDASFSDDFPYERAELRSRVGRFLCASKLKKVKGGTYSIGFLRLESTGKLLCRSSATFFEGGPERRLVIPGKNAELYLPRTMILVPGKTVTVGRIGSGSGLSHETDPNALYFAGENPGETVLGLFSSDPPSGWTGEPVFEFTLVLENE